MGNRCNCVTSQSTDEAEDALLGGDEHRQLPHHQIQQQVQHQQQTPRGPPPPYQVHPFYMLTEEQRILIVSRLAMIQSLPVGQYKWGKGEKKTDKTDKSDNRECPICMNDFIPGETIRLLPCMHYYHIRCIDEWLLRALTCPNCIQRVDLALQRSNSYRHGHSRNGSRGSICSMNNEISNNSNCSSPTGSSEQLHSPVFSSPTPQNVTAEVHIH